MIRTRNRPFNNALTAPGFGENATKHLPTRKEIDSYNHNHNLVDLADQLRDNFAYQRRLERQTWCPLAYWLIDVCLANSYLIWHSRQSQDALRERYSTETSVIS